jgi:DNA polymerase (family 10)
MDSRTAAHALSQIAAYLELHGENTFKCRAYLGAAKALQALAADDLAPLHTSGELAALRGLGPATLSVVRDLVETGESRYLEQLRASTPEGLVEMLEVPGLTPAKIVKIHESLGITTIEELEAAARDGRLAKLPRYGPKTAQKVLDGIAFLREHGSLRLYHHAIVEARNLVAMVAQHPDVSRAELAGSLRRRVEVARDADVVAACTRSPARVAQSFARLSGVKQAEGTDASVSIRFVDGARLDLYCIADDELAVALWRATGSPAHVAEVTARLVLRGYRLEGDRLLDRDGRTVAIPDEPALYRAAGLGYVEPELREGLGEVQVAAADGLPRLIERADLRGVLHCHSLYSDGKASIADMAQAAGDRGWSYIGISDHSQSAFYAGGLSREQILMQHEEIDELNARAPAGFRILKGIEADILTDGRLDYPEDVLDRFDYVIGSIHSRFSMNGAAMTERVLAALDQPHLTILGHPTGRLLLSRQPYAIDLDAVLEKARDVGAAAEHNADPHRLDLGWRELHRAKSLGVTVSIGPDAHSTRGLDYVDTGIGIMRKGWLTPDDVINTRSADDVIAFARSRREGGGRRTR